MKKNDKIMLIFNLLDSLDYEEHKDEIDEKCRVLLRSYIRERKQELKESGKIRKDIDFEFWNDYLKSDEDTGNEMLMNKLNRFSKKSFYDYYYSE
jgi:hypothetical protein